MKLLFFDIDGTLLPDSAHAVPQSAIDAIIKAKQAGHQIFINTGRTRVFVPEAVKQVQPDGYLCACGASIYLHGETVFHNTVPRQRAIEVVKKLRAMQLACCFEAEHTFYFDRCNTAFMHQKVQQLYAFLTPYRTDVGETFPENFTFQKFMVYNVEKQQIEDVRTMLGDDFHAIAYENGALEVVQSSFSKGSAMQWIAKNLRMTINDCYAFGDSENDFEMLSTAGHAVAMGNATPQIKALCEFVTTSILEDGIANALAHYQLCGE